MPLIVLLEGGHRPPIDVSSSIRSSGWGGQRTEHAAPESRLTQAPQGQPDGDVSERAAKHGQQHMVMLECQADRNHRQ